MGFLKSRKKIIDDAGRVIDTIDDVADLIDDLVHRKDKAEEALAQSQALNAKRMADAGASIYKLQKQVEELTNDSAGLGHK